MEPVVTAIYGFLLRAVYVVYLKYNYLYKNNCNMDNNIVLTLSGYAALWLEACVDDYTKNYAIDGQYDYAWFERNGIMYDIWYACFHSYDYEDFYYSGRCLTDNQITFDTYMNPEDVMYQYWYDIRIVNLLNDDYFLPYRNIIDALFTPGTLDRKFADDTRIGYLAEGTNEFSISYDGYEGSPDYAMLTFSHYMYDPYNSDYVKLFEYGSGRYDMTNGNSSPDTKGNGFYLYINPENYDSDFLTAPDDGYIEVAVSIPSGSGFSLMEDGSHLYSDGFWLNLIDSNVNISGTAATYRYSLSDVIGLEGESTTFMPMSFQSMLTYTFFEFHIPFEKEASEDIVSTIYATDCYIQYVTGGSYYTRTLSLNAGGLVLYENGANLDVLDINTLSLCASYMVERTSASSINFKVKSSDIDSMGLATNQDYWFRVRYRVNGQYDLYIYFPVYVGSGGNGNYVRLKNREVYVEMALQNRGFSVHYYNMPDGYLQRGPYGEDEYFIGNEDMDYYYDYFPSYISLGGMDDSIEVLVSGGNGTINRFASPTWGGYLIYFTSGTATWPAIYVNVTANNRNLTLEGQDL